MAIKVMTFNLRYPCEGDGINRFSCRAPRIAEAIRAAAPDLIGFQEADDESRAFLRSALADEYLLLGGGREPNCRGEGCPVAIRRSAFEVIGFRTEFLSDTPEIPGSRYASSDQSLCPRLFVAASLLTADGKRLDFYNTHLDHVGREARLLGMRQILASVAAGSPPFVLTGDMNATPDSPEARLPLALPGRSVADATAAIPHTFHDFGRRTAPFKIDYIYTDLPYANTAALPDIPEAGVFTSDHFAIVTEITL